MFNARGYNEGVLIDTTAYELVSVWRVFCTGRLFKYQRTRREALRTDSLSAHPLSPLRKDFKSGHGLCFLCLSALYRIQYRLYCTCRCISRKTTRMNSKSTTATQSHLEYFTLFHFKYFIYSFAKLEKNCIAWILQVNILKLNIKSDSVVFNKNHILLIIFCFFIICRS